MFMGQQAAILQETAGRSSSCKPPFPDLLSIGANISRPSDFFEAMMGLKYFLTKYLFCQESFCMLTPKGARCSSTNKASSQHTPVSLLAVAIQLFKMQEAAIKKARPDQCHCTGTATSELKPRFFSTEFSILILQPVSQRRAFHS